VCGLDLSACLDTTLHCSISPTLLSVEHSTRFTSMDSLQQQIQTYFRSRTKGGNGVLGDYIATPHRSHSTFYCNNDYLNLSCHENILSEQIRDFQASTGREAMLSSVFLTDDDPHAALEKDMGNWFGKECYLAQSGYAANVGLMHAICSKGQNVYVDKHVHMSFFDGLSARSAKIHPNRPNDAAHLEANIRANGPGIILIESIYSNTGVFAPLEEIVRIKKKYGCTLVVDESHSLGVSGSKGFVHLTGFEEDVDFVTASLAKAYACRAGVVFSSNALYIKENSFPYIFSSALTKNDIVRIRGAWEVIKTADDRRANLHSASRRLREGLSSLVDLAKTDCSMPSHIVCIQLRDEEEMACMHRHLSSRGVIVSPFFYPAVSLKRPMLRLTVHCGISEADIEDTCAAVASFPRTEQSKL
jgi:CAI-1 autoinducer synthase